MDNSRSRLDGSSGLNDNPRSRLILRIWAISSSSSGAFRYCRSDTWRPSSSRLFWENQRSRISITWVKRRKGSALSREETRSDSSTEVVPTRIGLPNDVVGKDLARDGAQLGFLGAVDDIRIILASPEDRDFFRVIPLRVIVVPVALSSRASTSTSSAPVRIAWYSRLVGMAYHAQLVDLIELFGLGYGGAAHPGQLFVHAEVVLDGDGGVGDIFGLDAHTFFGLDSLVQPIRPAPSGHQAAR